MAKVPAPTETGRDALIGHAECGLDRQAAQKAFEDFVSGKRLSAPQLDFLTLLIDVVVQRGVVGIGDLYEGPFTDRAPGGPEDLFENEEIDELMIVFQMLRTRAFPAALAA